MIYPNQSGNLLQANSLAIFIGYDPKDSFYEVNGYR